MLAAISCICLLCIGCERRSGLRGAWTIVKQKGKDNYGFVTELGYGIVSAGYTNRESAEAAMKEARWHFRNPQKPKPKNSVWEVQ